MIQPQQQQPLAKRLTDPAYEINADNIPPEMKMLDQWVCWVKEKRDGGETKVPYIPSSHGLTTRASSTSPSSWRSFEEALTCATKFRCGVGFVFSGEVIGIDLDAKPELTPVARSLLEMSHTYTEESPSGGGRHMIVKGATPDWFTGGRQGAVEVYTSGRYFTVTGKRVNGHASILEDQALVDTALKIVMPSAKQRARVELPSCPENPPANFRDLLPADVQGYLNGFSSITGDDSADDYATLKELMRIHPDAEWAWSVLVEGSARENPEKYEREDYRETTLQRAWASLLAERDVFEIEAPDAPSEFVSLYEIVNGPDPEPVIFSVAQMMTTGLHIFGAAPKTGKTRLMLQMAISIATGEPFMGQFPVHQQKVLYYMLEDSLSTLKNRLKAMDLKMPGPDQFVLKFTPPPSIAALRADLIATRAKFCAIDTAAMFLPGDSGKTGAYERDIQLYKPLKALCDELGVTIVVITHTTKAVNEDNPFSDIQGSLGKQGMASGMMVMRRVARDKQRAMLYVHGRDINMEEWMMEPVGETPVWQLASEEAAMGFGSGAAQAIIEALKTHGTSLAGDLADITGLTRQWVHQMLNRMLKAKIVSVDKHRYSLTNIVEVSGSEGSIEW